MSKLKLRITELADQDLNDLYVEGFTSWGEGQADRYYDGLLSRFERICENPMMYPAVDDIRAGYGVESGWGRDSIIRNLSC